MKLLLLSLGSAVSAAMIGDPSLAALSAGRRLDLVVLFEDGSRAKTLWHGERCWVEGLQHQSGETWTLYDVLFLGMTPHGFALEVDQQTKSFRKPSLDFQAFACMKEVCAGLGGISVGFAATGGRTSAFVDRTDLSCNALQLNSGLVINGDLSCRHVRIRLHEVEPHSAFILSAGIPCQGYSRQGNGLGFQDPRSQTLLHVLQCAWHTQAAAIVLECVVEIQASAEAMQCLCDFASRAGYVLHQVRLELSDQWCTRRHRWWGVLLPQHLPQPHMQPWPTLTPSLVVGDVIPEWPLWSPLDEAQLLWTEEEAQAYADPRLGTEPRILNVAGKAPTALHSYGNPLQGCPCRCRLQGFSLTRLYNRGLRGYGVPASHAAGTRYLHPQELGLLNTIPLTMRHVPEHRAALCLIGQLAAPLQSLWIGGQIRVWASEIYQMPCEPPLQMLEGFRSQLLQQRMDLWLLPSMLSGGEFVLSDHSGLRTIQSSGPVQVGQLLQAEAAFLEPGFKLQLWYEERHLPSEAFIHFASSQAYSLVQVRKRQAVTSPAATTRGGQPTSVASPASLPQPVDEMVPSPSTASTDVALLVGLLCLQQQTPAYRSLILPPLSMEGHAELLAASPETAAAIRSAVSRGILVLVPFHHDRHWALLAFPSLSDQETQIHLLDGIPGRSLLPGQQIVDLLSHCVPSAACRLLEVTLWTQVDSQSCGAIVLAHAAAYLQKGPSPEHLSSAQEVPYCRGPFDWRRCPVGGSGSLTLSAASGQGSPRGLRGPAHPSRHLQDWCGGCGTSSAESQPVAELEASRGQAWL